MNVTTARLVMAGVTSFMTLLVVKLCTPPVIAAHCSFLFVCGVGEIVGAIERRSKQ